MDLQSKQACASQTSKLFTCNQQTSTLSCIIENVHSVKAIFAIALLGILIFTFGLVYLIDSMLPTPLMMSDETTHPDSFITERARSDLKALTSIGPRVTGTYENEVLAVNFLQKTIETIIKNAHLRQKIELEIQGASGSFYLIRSKFSSFNVYGNIQNVVAKLEGNSNHSILVNAHFDTIPGSSGASDDGIMCAVMLEILRKLSISEKRLEHNVIFLFNGAEESPLKGSHAFITQHKWAKDVKIFLNLDAAGVGHKEHLFQTGPYNSWITNYYKFVPHPYAQAAGEELYETGLIPSGTDFRIFRDFGRISGYNFAISRDNYKYHTEYDNFANIPSGTYQHIGDNVLALVRSLGESTELPSAHLYKSCTKNVYFDFFGWIFVSYPDVTASIINIVVALLSCEVGLQGFTYFGLDFSKKHKFDIGVHFGDVIGGWIIGLLFVKSLACSLDNLDYTMSWYTNNWLVFGLFCVPTIAWSCFITCCIRKSLEKNRNLTIGALCQLQLHATRLIWTVLIFIFTSINVRSTYLIVIPVFFSTVSFGLIRVFKLQESVRAWWIIYLTGTIIPTLFLLYVALQMLALLIPTMGRIGPEENPDLIIGCLCYGFTILVTSFYTPLIILVTRPKIFFVTLLSIFFAFLFIVTTPIGFPFSGDQYSPTPERHVIFHVTRTMYDSFDELCKKDSGYFIVNMDHNSPKIISKYVREYEKAVDIEEMCSNFVLCGFPIKHTSIIGILKSSTWIPAEQVITHESASLKMISKSEISPTITRYYFTLTGPHEMTFHFSPRKGMSVHGTSLSEYFSHKAITWNDRPVYFASYTWGDKLKPLEFSVDIKTPPNWTGKTMDFAVSSFFMHSVSHTAQFYRFLSMFPDWTTVITGVATFESWVF